MNIFEAKDDLAQRYRYEEGFVGVGISHRGNEDTLRVYVIDSRSPVARKLVQDGQYRGFPIEIEVSGKIQAF